MQAFASLIREPRETSMTDVNRPNPAALGARSVGVGFKAEHFDAILESRPELDFSRSTRRTTWARAARHTAGSRRFASVIRFRCTASVFRSARPDHWTGRIFATRRGRQALRAGQGVEHLAWSTHDGGYLNDLFPLPYTIETLARVCDHIDEVQNALGRTMLLENPSTYVVFAESTFEETGFLSEIVRRTGCGLLLDINNVVVSAADHGFDASRYLADFPLHAVGEIHLAGYAEDADDAGLPLLIDAHNSPVRDDVWALYAEAIHRLGPAATLIEWDNDLPAWPALLGEARRAERIMAVAASHARERADVH